MYYNIDLQVVPFKFTPCLGIAIKLKGLLIVMHSNAFKILNIVWQN